MELDEIVRLAEEKPDTPTDAAPGESPKEPAAKVDTKPEELQPQAGPVPQPPSDAVSRSEFQQVVGILTQMAQQQANRQNQPPQQEAQRWNAQDPNDPESLLVDGKTLNSHFKGQLESLARYIEDNSGQAFGYIGRTLEDLKQQLSALTASQSGSAMDRAKAMAENLGADDFDEIWPEAQRLLQGNSQALANPNAILDAYSVARTRSGKSFLTEAKSDPPPSLTAKPPTRTAPKPDLSPIAAEAQIVAQEFGLTGPLEVDEVGLHELRRIGSIN